MPNWNLLRPSSKSFAFKNGYHKVFVLLMHFFLRVSTKIRAVLNTLNLQRSIYGDYCQPRCSPLLLQLLTPVAD